MYTRVFLDVSGISSLPLHLKLSKLRKCIEFRPMGPILYTERVQDNPPYVMPHTFGMITHAHTNTHRDNTTPKFVHTNTNTHTDNTTQHPNIFQPLL